MLEVQFFLVSLAVLHFVNTEPTVQISQGNLTGTKLTSRNGREFHAFLGIPYAEPPIENRRFKNPVEKGPWQGSLKVDQPVEWCMQYDLDNNISGSEDCLYMYVYTPWLPEENNETLPVMVWIHGGGFKSGDGYHKYYPYFLLDKDIVLVTMNYRLGIFGYLSTGDEAAPGNFGLKDQLMVLKWVQKNIYAFGGDPSKVTLAGQSAGGVSVNLHALSEKSRGLFSKYIIQSGCALNPWAYQDIKGYKGYSVKVARKYGCPEYNSSVMVDCLRKLSASQLLDSDDIFDPLVQLLTIGWMPTKEAKSDDAFLTESPLTLVLNNEMDDLPFMTGSVRDEGLLMTSALYENNMFYRMVRQYFKPIVASATNYYSGLPPFDAIRLTDLSCNYYFGNQNLTKVEFIQQATAFMTDAFFIYPEMVMMDWVSKVNTKPCYYYSFEYRGALSSTIPELNGKNIDIGVDHADELFYLFYQDDKAIHLPKNITMSNDDMHMIDVIVDLWTSFVTNGKPTSKNLPDPNIWLPYVPGTYHLQIGNNSNTSVYLQNKYLTERMNFWRSAMLQTLLPNE
ncbi:carboxylic ester hydrolase-like [Prorops nasuta]|uniref:carboxylic ester hydrolase-like n=1 Tax=Prorops nasuta TaxID=863751 RepID=UPI0034CF44EC